eukprot:2524183-Alexandrium_andersonii.AAC.1
MWDQRTACKLDTVPKNELNSIANQATVVKKLFMDIAKIKRNSSSGVRLEPWLRDLVGFVGDHNCVEESCCK